MLKKTTLAVIGLAVSGLASAGMYSTPPAPTCTPGDVTVPCVANMWDIGVQALYLNTTYSRGLAYQLNTTGTLREVDPDGGWGYRLEGSYHFGTGNDITFDWTHYDVNDTLLGYRGSYPLLTIFGPVTVPANYSLYLDNKFDQVNMVLGQHTDMGLLKNARFYGGFQYADIRVKGLQTFSVSPAVVSAIGGVRGQYQTDFNGVGPVIGIDYSYDLTPAFSITANTATSILFGTARTDNSVLYNNGLVPVDIYGSKKSIVPSLQAKLGANYAFPLAYGILNIEGGYEVINYFNALQNQTPGINNVFGTRGVATNDFSLYGPYFGLKWLGNA